MIPEVTLHQPTVGYSPWRGGFAAAGAEVFDIVKQQVTVVSFSVLFFFSCQWPCKG